MTLAELTEEGKRKEYILLNVGDALHVLQYSDEEGDTVKTTCFKREIYPTCHCFAVAADGADILVGLSSGEVALLSLRALLQGVSYISPVSPLAVFGVGRSDDDIRCTSVCWTSTEDPMHFVATYSDGQVRIFEKPRSGSAEMRSRSIAPNETMDVGGGGIHDAAVSPDESKLAVASKDGLLRIFCVTARQLLSGFQSYYGGLLCCAWSPDSKYVATGGEDDLVTVFSVEQGTVVAFGEGHSSWISQVAFDFGVEAIQDGALGTSRQPQSFIYRVGSVSQDTQVALWDFEVDISSINSRDSVSSPKATANGAIEEEEEPSCIALAVPHRDMVIIPPVMLHKYDT